MKRILLVEDEQDMMYAVKMQLEAHGLEVIEAKDGQEALEKPDGKSRISLFWT